MCLMLTLVVPVLGNCLVMVIELLVMSILRRRTRGEQKQNGESCCEMCCSHFDYGPPRPAHHKASSMPQWLLCSPSAFKAVRHNHCSSRIPEAHNG
jgi:hypothetical protein